MRNKKNRILVLGNGPSINDINFKRLAPDIKTFGVNRIWLAHIPDYFFFHDIDILKELTGKNQTINNLKSNSVIFTSDWIKSTVPNWIRMYPRHNRKIFPDSVTMGLNILSNHILKENLKDYVFYMAGIHLRWIEPSHFWKDESFQYISRNKNDKKWYAPRFNKVLHNLSDMQKMGFRMISVTQDSNLNKIMRYENIANLYK